jgi:hypothetical protein
MSTQSKWDRNAWDRVLSTAKAVGLKPYIDAGFPPGAKLGQPSRKGSGHAPWKSMVELAYVMGSHEFGRKDGHYPARPFMRPALQKCKEEVKKLQAMVGTKIIKGELSLPMGLAFIGNYIAERIKTELKSLKSPALKPSTIKAKGRSELLRDTDQALNSITYVSSINGKKETIATPSSSPSKVTKTVKSSRTSPNALRYSIAKGPSVRSTILKIASQVRRYAR